MLESLIEEGWRVVGVFGRNMIILRKANGVIVYNIKTNKIVDANVFANKEMKIV